MSSLPRLLLRSNLMTVKNVLRTYSGAAQAPNVPGLSANCVKVPKDPVGPGAKKDGQYKNPEYFCYNVTSYFEAEIEMAKFRLPQPSNKK